TITSNPDGYLFGSCFAKYDVTAARAASKVGLQVAVLAVLIKPPTPTIAIAVRIPTTTIVTSSSISVKPRSSGRLASPASCIQPIPLPAATTATTATLEGEC